MSGLFLCSSFSILPSSPFALTSPGYPEVTIFRPVGTLSHHHSQHPRATPEAEIWRPVGAW